MYVIVYSRIHNKWVQGDVCARRGRMCRPIQPEITRVCVCCVFVRMRIKKAYVYTYIYIYM